jgi:drug/metabolite transporter (DMT)-like permease
MHATSAPVLARSSTTVQQATIALIGGALLIALAPIFVRLAETGPTATAFWRLALASPVLLLWHAGGTARPGRARWIPPRRELRAMALAGLFFAGDLAAWHTSIDLTSVANATLLANAAPIFVVTAMWLLFGERPRARFLAGLALALLGGVILARASAGGAPGRLEGDALGLLTAMFYAGYMLTVKGLRSRGIGTATVMAGSSVTGAAILLPLALASGDAMLPTSPHGWAILAGLAVLSQVCGQGLIAWAMGRLTASYSSLALLSQTAGAAALAWALFGEAFTIPQSLGVILVASGLVVARTPDDSAPPLARPPAPV